MKGVSIIICCHNSAKRIVKTLQHILLLRNEGIQWEIILVDNLSTDNTIEIAKSVWKTQNNFKNLKIVTEPQLGLKFAREKGIKTARFDYLIFVDDDNWLSCNYIIQVYRMFEESEKISLIGGLGEPVSDSPLPTWFNRFQNLFAVGRPVAKSGILPKGSGYVYGAGMCLRKSAYLKLESLGFYSLSADRKGKHLSGGHDVELTYALRLIDHQVVFDESLVFSHYVDQNRATFSYLKRLCAGSAANTVPFIYYLFLCKKVKSDWKFILFYIKRIFGDLIDLFSLFHKNSLDYYEKEVRKASYLSSIKYFIISFFPSFAYYKNIRRMEWDVQRRKYGKDQYIDNNSNL